MHQMLPFLSRSFFVQMQCNAWKFQSGACSYLSAPQLINRFTTSLPEATWVVLFLISRAAHHITILTNHHQHWTLKLRSLVVKLQKVSWSLHTQGFCNAYASAVSPKPLLLAQQAVTSASISTEALTARSTSANAGISNQSSCVLWRSNQENSKPTNRCM